MSETPDIDVQYQTAFGDDGELEVSESSVETSLEDFGSMSITASGRHSSIDPRPASSGSTTVPKCDDRRAPTASSRRCSPIRPTINGRSPANERTGSVSTRTIRN